jgi:DNA invertase Pin-like site-specific DNA recombinase
MRVSTTDQKPELQIDALLNAGIDRRHMFEDRISGWRPAQAGRGAGYVAEGDVLVM